MKGSHPAAVLLPRCDFYLSVLQVKPSGPLPGSLRSIADALPTSRPSKLDLRVIKKKLESGAKPGQVFAEVTSPIEYSRAFCRALLTVLDTSVDVWHSIASVFLWTYLGWPKVQEVADVLLICDCFVTIHEHLKDSSDTNVISMIGSGFYYSLRKFLGHTRYPKNTASILLLKRFFTATPDISAHFYSIILNVLDSLPPLEDERFPPSVLEVFSFVQTLHKTLNPDFFAQFVAHLRPGLIALDPCTLPIFGSFCTALPEETLNFFVAEMAYSFADRILAHPKLTIAIPDIDRSEIEPQVTSIFRLAFPCAIDFEEGFVFPDALDGERLVRKPISDLAQLFRSFFFSCRAPITQFARHLAAKSQHSFDGIAAFLIVLRGHPSAPECVPFLWNSVLFDQNLSIFSESRDRQVISSLRAVATEMMEYGDCAVVLDFMTVMKDRPEIVAELLLRLSSAPLTRAVRYDFVAEILKRAISYQSRTPVRTGVKRLLVSVFVLLSKMFMVPDFLLFFFADSFFRSAFTSFLFDSSVREFAMQVILARIRNPVPFDEELSSHLANVLTISAECFPNDDAMRLTLNLFSGLNGLLAVNRNLAPSFLVIRTAILQIMTALTRCDSGKELGTDILQEVLLFFTHTSGTTKTKSVIVFLFGKAMKALYGHEVPDKYHSSLIQVIAGRTLSSFVPKFTIAEPEFVTFFLKIHQKTDKFLSALEFVHSLCEISHKNAIACHRGRVDLYLIRLLANPVSDEVRQITLKIFARIACLITSCEVICAYFSLLRKVNGCISPQQPLLMTTLTSVISKCYSVPSASIPLLSATTKIFIRDIDGSLAESGLTVAFWIFWDKVRAKYEPHVFTLEDEMGQRIRLTVKSESFILIFRTHSTESKGIGELRTPMSSWSLLTISFKFEQNVTIAVMQVDCKAIADFMLPTLQFSSRFLRMFVGGTEPDSDDSDEFVQLATFGLFSYLESNQLTLLFQTGPRLRNKLPFNSLFMAQPVQEERHLKLNVTGDVNYEIRNNSDHFTSSFIDVLVDSSQLRLLCPLFTQFFSKFPDGSPFTASVQLTMELFGTSIARNLRAQEVFAEVHGCAVLADLLTVWNYNIYSRFFGVFESIQCRRLQKDMFESILFSCELLVNASDAYLIVRHWSRTLIPFAQSLGLILPTFRDILAILLIYPNLSQNPQILPGLLNIATQFPLEDQDVNNLLSYCLHCPDSRQVLELLRLIPDITHRRMFDELKTAFARFHFHKILSLFSTENAEIAVAALNAMLVLIGEGIITFLAKVDIVNLLIRQIQFFSEELMNALEVLQDPDLFPLLIWISFGLGKEDYISRRKPSLDFCTHFSWPMWPLTVAYRASSAYCKKIIWFLVMCSGAEWDNIFFTAQVVGDLARMDPAPMQALILAEIYELLAGQRHLAFATRFYSLFHRFVYFHQERDTNKALAALQQARTGPAPAGYVSARVHHHRAGSLGSMRPRRSESMGSQQPMITDSVESLRSSSEKKRKLVFGLRISEGGDWQDRELAISFVKLAHLSLHPESEFVNLYFVTIGFLMRVGMIGSQPSAAIKPPSACEQFCTYQRMRRQGVDVGLLGRVALSLDELLPCAFSQAVTRTELTSANRLHGFSSALAQQMRVTFEIDGTETQFSKFYQSSIMRLRQQYREERRQCFRQITSKTAPWRLDRHVRKRLSSACAYFCPLKFKFVRKTANQEDVMPRSFQSNATWIRRTRQTPIRLTLHSDRFAINQPNGKRLDIEKSEIAEAFLTPKTDEKKSRVLWVLRSRRAILLECSDPVFNKISLGNETFFNAEWIQEWAARRMSSFELLMRLNLSFGRSFEDSCHYPIVPPLDIPSSTVDFFFSSGVLPIADVYANRRRLEHSDLKGWIESNFPIELPNRHPFYETEMTIKRIETGFAGPTEALIDPDVYLYRDCQLLKVSADGFQEVQNLPKIPGSVLVAQFGSYFVVSGLKASRFEMVSKKDLQSQFYSVGNDQITAICGGGSCVILAMKNTIVRVVEAEGRARSIPVYLHSITCVTFNPLFDVVAVGDKWGNVVLCFLSTGEVFQHVKLKRKRIVKVHLTCSWGLLVIEAAGKYGRDHWVYVYTQDGQRLGEWGLSRELAGIASFASGSGFDHLVLADLNGAVFILDPVKLANGRPSSRLNRALVGVGYDAASGAVVTADRTGQVVYIQKQWE